MVKSARFWVPFGGALAAFAGAVVGFSVFGGLTVTLGASLPTVIVRYEPGASVARGQIASVCFPQDVIDFTRRYDVRWFGTGCPTGDGHVFKIVAAVAGDRVTIARAGVTIDNVPFPMSESEHPDRVWPSVVFGRSFIVPSGRVILLGWAKSSIDSRYVGLFPVSAICGRIIPVWPGPEIFAVTNTERSQ
jgi:conjugative transfer signal peptidase TraF